MIRCIKLGAIFAVWPGFFAVLLLCYGWTALFRLAHRWRIISRISRSFLLFLRKALRIRVEVHGDCGRLQAGGCVIIANHVSYVDGIVLGSIFPVVLVTKAEVREWPVIGQWAALCGTVFVERGRRHSIGELVAAIRAKLKDGANILLFPEGTASDGERLLPFQTAVLAAPLRSRSAIVPVTITYERIDTRPVSAANRDRIYCYGPMAFVPHFWRLLGARGVEATVTIQPVVECSRYPDNTTARKKLAADCYQRISAGLQAARDREAGNAGVAQQLFCR